MKIVLISCVSKKLNRLSKASDLYISPLFKHALTYAHTLKPDKIFILSAKHGLLSLDDKIAPYEQTLNNMTNREIQNWSKNVLSQLHQQANLNQDEFIFLAGNKYRKYLLPQINNYSLPLQGLGIGKQLKFLKDKTKNEQLCKLLHQRANKIQRFNFPFDKNDIPANGIYLLFEKKEFAHGGNRIVRIGTHTGDNQLSSRLRQHFVNENKDRSIFRKNIGRSLLNQAKDHFLKWWEIDLTPKKARDKYAGKINMTKQENIEKQVSNYIQHNFSFCVISVENKMKRLELESKIISTLSHCQLCKPSADWFGLYSPKQKICQSGLWQVNELNKTPLTEKEIKELLN